MKLVVSRPAEQKPSSILYLHNYVCNTHSLTFNVLAKLKFFNWIWSFGCCTDDFMLIMKTISPQPFFQMLKTSMTTCTQEYNWETMEQYLYMLMGVSYYHIKQIYYRICQNKLGEMIYINQQNKRCQKTLQCAESDDSWPSLSSGMQGIKPRPSCVPNPCHPGVKCLETSQGIKCGPCPDGMQGNGSHCTDVDEVRQCDIVTTGSTGKIIYFSKFKFI